MPLSPAEGGCGAAEGAGASSRAQAGEGGVERCAGVDDAPLSRSGPSSRRCSCEAEGEAAAQRVGPSLRERRCRGRGRRGARRILPVVEGEGVQAGEGWRNAGPLRGRGGYFYCGAFVALLGRFCLPSKAARGQQEGSGLREGREGAGVLAEVVEKMEGVGAIEAEGEFFGALLALFWP